MAQMGFFDLSDRYASLDAKKDPLVEINDVVPWEEFRPLLEQVWRKPESERKSRAGRKPIDAVLMFKTLVLGALYNLSDDQVEYQIRDRLSFTRFLGLGLGDRVPDATTVWLYREALAQAGKVEELFKLFDGHLARQGYIARGGQILDASIVPVPRNHNTREENAAIKGGGMPEGWENKPAKRSQKDVDARWTKKHGKSHYGYKNHVNVDRKHKLIRRYHVSDAALHDSQAVDELLSLGEVRLASRFDGGILTLKPGKEGTQEKSIPIDVFFHKITMVRDRLRVLEQRINNHSKLSESDKVEMQQYVTRIYGSLTSFNVLFKEKNDWFIGSREGTK